MLATYCSLFSFIFLVARNSAHTRYGQALKVQAGSKDKKIVSSSNVANAYYYIGEYDNALKYLEMAIEEKDPQLSFLYFSREWKELFDNKKFNEIRDSLKLPAQSKK